MVDPAGWEAEARSLRAEIATLRRELERNRAWCLGLEEHIAKIHAAFRLGGVLDDSDPLLTALLRAALPDELPVHGG